jgi:hypothetical protein
MEVQGGQDPFVEENDTGREGDPNNDIDSWMNAISFDLLLPLLGDGIDGWQNRLCLSGVLTRKADLFFTHDDNE